MKHLFFHLFYLLLHHAKSDVDLKKQSQPKSRDLRLIRWEFLGLQAQETASQVTLREVVQGGGMGERGGGVGRSKVI